MVNQIDVNHKKILTDRITEDNLFLAFDNQSKKWIAVDTEKEFYVEDFEKIDDAIKWLRNIK